ncbi:MAG: hypothetical protein ABIQ35_00430 [Verrucomicrobiota bacterium]
MKSDPLTTALRSVAETKHLVEALLFSSEKFDNLMARKTVARLHRKLKELGRLQAEMEAFVQARHPNIRMVNFRPTPEHEATL